METRRSSTRRASGRCSCSSASTSCWPSCRSCGICFVAGLVAVRRPGRPEADAGAIKPDFKKLNPASGLKNLFNPQHFAFETGKNVAKTAIVGAIAAMAVFPKLDELAALVGTPPAAADPRGRRAW